MVDGATASGAGSDGGAVSLVQWYMQLEHDRNEAESQGVMGSMLSGMLRQVYL